MCTRLPTTGPTTGIYRRCPTQEKCSACRRRRVAEADWPYASEGQGNQEVSWTSPRWCVLSSNRVCFSSEKKFLGRWFRFRGAGSECQVSWTPPRRLPHRSRSASLQRRNSSGGGSVRGSEPAYRQSSCQPGVVGHQKLGHVVLQPLHPRCRGR